MRNTKKFIISLIFFLILCSTASAFEDTAERYPNNLLSDYWTVSSGSTTAFTYPSGSTYHVLGMTNSTTKYTNQFDIKTINSVTNITYLSFTLKHLYIASAYSSGGGNAYLTLYLVSESGTNLLSYDIYRGTPPNTPYYINDMNYELVSSRGSLYLYKNGTYISDLGSTPTEPVYIRFSGMADGYSSYYTYSEICIDDISTEGSVIGTPELWNELSNSITYSYRVQAYSSYPAATYNITLYSITNTNNAGNIFSQTITQQNGNLAFNRSLLGTNNGLYMIELTRDSTVLQDTYFYYYLSANPEQFPEILFLGESDVLAEIYDEDNNGGEVTSGGSVYLYPNINENGEYTVSYIIKETPYAIKTELSSVYNTTSINSTTLQYSGLSSQNYNVSANGATVGHTNGADTYSHIFSNWGEVNNNIISFSPDYSLAGVWGEVKNSETNEGIKAATVSIAGENFTKTIYTDDNGLYYYTKDMQAGQTYTISVSKTGYESTPSQATTTQSGITSRVDFYLDKKATESGSGLYYAPHDVGFTVLEYWYSGAGLTGVNYAIYNGTESIKTGITDSKGMFTGSDMSRGTNYTIILTYDGKTYTEYVEPSQTEYTFVLNKEGILHQYVNSWLNLTYTENTNNVTIAYNSNKTITGASLTAIAGNGTTVYTQTLSTDTGSFTFETGGEGDYTLNFHIQATDGSTASQSWGLSYPNKIPLFPDSYPAWLKNVLFSGIVMIFLLAFGKSKNDIACGAVAILTSMGYIFEWFTGSFYFVVLVWIVALGAVFLHYKRTGGIG